MASRFDDKPDIFLSSPLQCISYMCRFSGVNDIDRIVANGASLSPSIYVPVDTGAIRKYGRTRILGPERIIDTCWI
jgi:hypothetical protein